MVQFGCLKDSGRGYKTYVPNSLLEIEKEIDVKSFNEKITKATLSLGQLNALNILLPNPDLLIEKYALREALLSSQIEGIQSTMVELFQNENNTNAKVDIIEVQNYQKALKYGIEQIKKDGLPLSARLLRNCHQILMKNVRDREADKTPGEFRRSQNYIGGNKPGSAIYVPPREDYLDILMSDFEKYIHYGMMPDVIKMALLHYQFETIHPFLDGNGRIGRLLISLFLVHKNILTQPTLYLSLYLKVHKQRYYDLLTDIRKNNNIYPWFEFFLDGIVLVCNQIIETTKKITELKDNLGYKLKTENEHKLLNILFVNPTITVSDVQDKVSVSKATANKIVAEFERKDILVQTNVAQRYKQFVFKKYIDLIEADF